MAELLLTRTTPTQPARAAVLLLHGGAVRSLRPVDGRSASWQRARALQRDLAPRLEDAAIAVWLLRFRVRGWNDPSAPSPVADARWALDRMRRELDVPVALLGHSMGARTAVHVADDPAVRGVVGLAPWLPPGEPVAALRDRHLVVGHGRRDRITSFTHSQEFVGRARAVAHSASFHDMGDRGHYLLRGSDQWTALAAASVRTILAG